MLEKTGIFIDIARLSILLITLNNVNVKQRTKHVNLLATLATIVLVSLVVAIYYFYLTLDGLDASINKAMSPIQCVLTGVYSIYSNGGIITAYLIIYIVMKRKYIHIQLNFANKMT